jgi:hypothetical protein
MSDDHQIENLDGDEVQTAQAKIRTEQAETRTQQDNTRDGLD